MKAILLSIAFGLCVTLTLVGCGSSCDSSGGEGAASGFLSQAVTEDSASGAATPKPAPRAGTLQPVSEEGACGDVAEKKTTCTEDFINGGCK